ncbi:MAG: family 78 glycoside hydrolase catalytic domain, partial [Clostridia bacterium]
MDSIYHARWITTDMAQDDYSARIFQRTVKFDKKVIKAFFHVTALGLYEAYVNNKRVGKDYKFLPGYTHYARRVQYQTFDVTKLIKDNQAILSVHVARGWFSGHICGDPAKMPFAIACALDVVFEDGTKDFYISMANDNWKAAKTKVIFSDIYDGETYDERIAIHDFHPVRTAYGYNPNDLVKHQGEYVKEQEILPALKLITTPKNEKVIDFGQNMTGYIRFKVKGKLGQRFVISHAEVLDNEGNFYTDNLRGAKQRIEYISNGFLSTYSPHFSFQGFRYIRLDEWTDNVNLEDIKAVVVHSDMKRTGFFESSNQLLNKLYMNTIWGQKGNFLDVPTDCPQRDERLGWTGDAQVFAKAASYNYDVKKFFTKWLSDLTLCQATNGAVPVVIPIKYSFTGVSSAWGDAATIVPFQMYLTYGDREILSDQYESMAAWVEYIKNSSDNPYLWNNGNHYGDWLALDVPSGTYKGKTDPYLISTVYYANSVDILRKSSILLKKSKKVIAYYEDLYANISKAFNEAYWQDDKLVTDTQTAYVLALYFDLLNEDRRNKAISNLV